jgi:hypothetical protein
VLAKVAFSAAPPFSLPLVWQRGFFDGRESSYFARMHGFYEFLSVAKTYELEKQRRSA